MEVFQPPTRRNPERQEPAQATDTDPAKETMVFGQKYPKLANWLSGIYAHRASLAGTQVGVPVR